MTIVVNFTLESSVFVRRWQRKGPKLTECSNSENISIRDDFHLSGVLTHEKLCTKNLPKFMASLGKLSLHHFSYLTHIWSIFACRRIVSNEGSIIYLHEKWSPMNGFIEIFLPSIYFGCSLFRGRNIIYVCEVTKAKQHLETASFSVIIISAFVYETFLALNSMNTIIRCLIDVNDSYYDCVSELRAYYRKCIINDIRTAYKATVMYV